MIKQIVQIRLAHREKLPELRNDQQRVLDADRSYGNLVIMARILSELGEFDEADKAFAEALANYNDTSPFPFAFINFQRGVMWGENAGQPSRARVFYEEAVYYLPEYVIGEVHLAEILRGESEQASAYFALEKVRSAVDPEPRGLLGELLQEDGRTILAQEAIQSAAQSYEQLLRDYPLAFADHASEFYARPGKIRSVRLNLRSSISRTEKAFVRFSLRSKLPRRLSPS